MSNNERVIDELTADLADCMQRKEPPSKSSDPQANPGDHAATHSGRDPTDESVFNTDDYPKLNHKRSDDLDDDKESKSDDEDYIDEEALKDAEVDLSDDQKSERQIIAEELKKRGNDAFKEGDYVLSIERYTDGLRQCPLAFSRDRAVLYCNRSAAKMKLEKYDKAIVDCCKALELDETYLKAYVRRAQSYECADKLEEALADYKKILEMDSSNEAARKATRRLPPLIEERNEKLKTEMMGKLKELGNMILKPFGLSTENFQVQQDGESKGYSINFKQ